MLKIEAGIDGNQARLLAQVRDAWLAAAHSCASCDRQNAEEAVRDAYRVRRLPRPQIIWFRSLAELHQGVQVLDLYDACRRPAPELARSWGGAVVRRAFHGGLLRPQAARARLHDDFWADPNGFIGDWPVPMLLRARIDQGFQAMSETGPARHELSKYARAARQLWQAAGFEADASVTALSALGQGHGAVLWQSYLEFGLANQQAMATSLAVLREVGWFVPLSGLALLVERPLQLSFNQNLELDDHEGKAVWWRNGETASYRGGIPVPLDLWHKTLNEVLLDRNLERRAVYMKLRGWADSQDAVKVLSTTDDPANPGHQIQLIELAGADGPRRFIEVTNASPDMDGTRRRYVIEVDPSVDDPIVAVASTFGLDADTYRGLQRAC